jgi:hypothetical protein
VKANGCCIGPDTDLDQHRAVAFATLVTFVILYRPPQNFADATQQKEAGLRSPLAVGRV